MGDYPKDVRVSMHAPLVCYCWQSETIPGSCRNSQTCRFIFSARLYQPLNSFVFSIEFLCDLCSTNTDYLYFCLLLDFESEGQLSVITDIPLGHLCRLVSEVRVREYNKETWQSWYNRTGSGHLLRQASTAACIINEMLFGLSDEAFDTFTKIFQKSKTVREEARQSGAEFTDGQQYKFGESTWKTKLKKAVKSHLIDCVGKIMHEYVSSEVWDLPTDRKSSLLQSDEEAEDITLHFFRDTAILHQEISIFLFQICK